MIDSFVLTSLRQGLVVLDKTYYVAWDCSNNVAKVVYTKKDDSVLYAVGKEFDSELLAHAYILGLRSLHQEVKEDWRDI